MATAKKQNKKVTPVTSTAKMEKTLSQNNTLLFVVALLVIVLAVLYYYNYIY